MNHFELFGLSSQFELDDSLLSSQFRELQRLFHPDKFASGSEQERLLAVQKAAQINDAYQILKDPVTRAEYILSLHGIELRNEQQTMREPQFLMRQMELREELDVISGSKDAEDLLGDFEQKVQFLYKELLQNVVTCLAEKNWSPAAIGVRKLKFIIKLQQEIERLEDQLLG